MRKSTLFVEQLWRRITIDLKKTELVKKNELQYNSILRTGKAWKYYCFASRICKLAVLGYFCVSLDTFEHMFFFFFLKRFIIFIAWNLSPYWFTRNTGKYFLTSCFLKLKKSHNNRKIELRRKWCTEYRGVERNTIRRFRFNFHLSY